MGKIFDVAAAREYSQNATKKTQKTQERRDKRKYKSQLRYAEKVIKEALKKGQTQCFLETGETSPLVVKELKRRGFEIHNNPRLFDAGYLIIIREESNG